MPKIRAASAIEQAVVIHEGDLHPCFQIFLHARCRQNGLHGYLTDLLAHLGRLIGIEDIFRPQGGCDAGLSFCSGNAGRADLIFCPGACSRPGTGSQIPLHRDGIGAIGQVLRSYHRNLIIQDTRPGYQAIISPEISIYQITLHSLSLGILQTYHQEAGIGAARRDQIESGSREGKGSLIGGPVQAEDCLLGTSQAEAGILGIGVGITIGDLMIRHQPCPGSSFCLTAGASGLVTCTLRLTACILCRYPGAVLPLGTYQVLLIHHVAFRQEGDGLIDLIIPGKGQGQVHPPAGIDLRRCIGDRIGLLVENDVCAPPIQGSSAGSLLHIVGSGQNPRILVSNPKIIGIGQGLGIIGDGQAALIHRNCIGVGNIISLAVFYQHRAGVGNVIFIFPGFPSPGGGGDDILNNAISIPGQVGAILSSGQLL